MKWQQISSAYVLIPSTPIGIIHFLGGAFVATAPQVTYRYLLEELGKKGYVIVATPFINTLDHKAIAYEVFTRFEYISKTLSQTGALGQTTLPVYGMGHSLGCKLHLLIGSLFSVARAGNILISYNNYPVNKAIPLVEQLELDETFDLEFTPNPQETEVIIANNYQIKRNLLIRFNNDTIDQTEGLNNLLKSKFTKMISFLTLPGNHLTPLSQKFNWQTGEVFTPIDAVFQWFEQGISRDARRLHQEIYYWLNPFGLLANQEK